MSDSMLFNAVTRLSELTHAFTDADLDQPWTWQAHDEGVRFALLGTYHELREMAISLASARAEADDPITRAQRGLSQYHAAYRDLQAVLIGVDDDIWGRTPSAGEWTVHQIIAHIVSAERHFFTLIHYGLDRQRDGQDRPVRLPDDEVERVVGPSAHFEEVRLHHDMAGMLAYYAALHQRALDEFATISETEIMGPSLWWEEKEYPLLYRLHRFDAHLRQHTAQAEKALSVLDHDPNEARRLLRLIFQALAEVEGILIGAPELEVAKRQELADTILSRADEAAARVAQARELTAAVEAGETDRVVALLVANPALADVVDQNHVPLVMAAAYRRNQGMVAAIVEAGATLFLWEAAAIGRIDIVRRDVERWPEAIDLVTRDGFTPLQLACFFGHEEIARWLIQQGADVNAIAQNEQRIAPVHAAAAAGSLAILATLLDNGADADARQQNDFTPLHTAAVNGDVRMAQLLLDHGAKSSVMSGDGLTPLDLAASKGHAALIDLLR